MAVSQGNMSSSPSPAASIDSSAATIENSQQYRNELTVIDSHSYDQNASSGNEVAFDTAPLPSNSSISDLQSNGQNISSSDEVGFDAAPSPSSLSRQQQADIKPTRFVDKLDLTRIHACAHWSPDQKVENILLDIHWSDNFAFIKFYKRLLLEDSPGVSRSKGRNVYIFIGPERIQRLSFTTSPNILPFGAYTISLIFNLNRPPALILPKTDIGFADTSMRDSLNSLAQQSCFTIYANIPQRMILHTRLQQFCKDVTEHKYTSIRKLANWKILYRGSSEEAEMIEGDSLLEHAIDPRDAAAPRLPPYQEMELPPTHSTKRKRPHDESSETVHTTDAVQAINAIIDARHAFHYRRLEEMYSAYKRDVEELEEEKRELKEVKRELKEVKCELKNMISKEEAEELMNRMDGIDKSIIDMSDTVEVSVLETICSTPLYFAR